MNDIVWLVKNRNGAYITGAADYSRQYPVIGEALAWTAMEPARDYACGILGDLVEARIVPGEPEYQIVRIV